MMVVINRSNTYTKIMFNLNYSLNEWDKSHTCAIDTKRQHLALHTTDRNFLISTTSQTSKW